MIHASAGLQAWHHDQVYIFRGAPHVTLAEAATVLNPEMTERQLRQIIHALGWKPARRPEGGRGHHATYPWQHISDLHQALLPFLQETPYALSGGVCPDEAPPRLPLLGEPLPMRRILMLFALPLAAVFAFAAPAYAGSAHFVDGTVTATRTGGTLTVSGKEAGLGNLDQVHIVASVTAACLNPGQQYPQAGNKETVTASGDFPVQNGKAYFSLDLAAVFQPSCSPPMTIVFSDVTVTDTTNNVTAVLPGLF